MVNKTTASNINPIVILYFYDEAQKLRSVLPCLSDTHRLCIDLLSPWAEQKSTKPTDLLNALEPIQDPPAEVKTLIEYVQWTVETGGQTHIQCVRSAYEKVLLNLMQDNASPLEKLDALQMLQRGELRTVFKIHTTESFRWQSQPYAIAAIHAAFNLFTMGSFSTMPQYVDKIPLWTQEVNLEKGVKSPFKTEQHLLKTGVRLIPGSFARFGAYIGAGTTVMPGGIINTGAYVSGEGVMIDGGARVASGAHVGKGVKIGAGTGLEGVLEPAGMIPTIVEDHVRIGANCEVSGIVGEKSLIASGVVMAAGKKIFDEQAMHFIEPLYVETADGVKAVPYIPPNRIAIGGSWEGKDVVRLLKKRADESHFMEIPKNAQLYNK